MTDQSDAPEKSDQANMLEKLADDILSKKVSLFELLNAPSDGDYWGAVQRARLFSLLSNDLRILKHFSAELKEQITAIGGNLDDRSIEKGLAFKDGNRRFSKLMEHQAEIHSQQPSLLTGDTFEICLKQYQTLISHVEKLWANACELYRLENFPLSVFLAILVIEEIGKLSRLANDLVTFDVPRPETQAETIERSHRRKHLIAVFSGALINARLDRVLGKDVIRKLLHTAESDGLEKIRQSCLYIDMKNGIVSTPPECISKQDAEIFTVLAGELMAEVLGYFPWEFTRMIESVINFERSIGLSDKRIAF